jgi:hypothetical protein
MWSVVLVNQSGAIVEVLSCERELRGAVAFAAGYGATLTGAAVVMPSDVIKSVMSKAVAAVPQRPTPGQWACKSLCVGAVVNADSVEDRLPTGITGGQFSVFVQSDGIESQFNTEPYDAEQVAMLLESIDFDFEHVRIVRATLESIGCT